MGLVDHDLLYMLLKPCRSLNIMLIYVECCVKCVFWENRIPSATGYGAAAAALGLYFTDWKLVLQYLPFYNGKFEEK